MRCRSSACACRFRPTDFTQVNAAINRVLVARALGLLAVQADERVIDWFCGLGNFSLPLATRAAQVLGIEGSEALVQRARDNAALNGLAAKTRFEARDLFDIRRRRTWWRRARRDKWLVDPPREGAFALAKALAELHADSPCPDGRHHSASSTSAATRRRWRAMPGCWSTRPAIAARMAGVVNMFPHTAHVESLAVFEHGDG